MNYSSKTRKAGFSLIEVTLALGVAGFCLLAIFGLLPVGINSNRISVEQSDAANIVGGVIMDLRNAPKNTSASPAPTSIGISPRFGFKLLDTTAPQVLYFDRDGNPLGTVGNTPIASTNTAVPTGNAFFRVSVGFVPPPTKSKNATQVRLLVTWPTPNPSASTAAKWPTSFGGSFETSFALNCN